MTMRATHLLMAVLLVGASACAVATTTTMTVPAEQDADLRLERGLTALDQGQFRAAFDDLAWVYARCAGHTRSVHALAGLAALELDPRNDAGRPGVGTELLGRMLAEPGTPEWTRPLATSSYLMAVALGAEEVGGPPPAAEDTTGAAAADADGEPADTTEAAGDEALEREPGEEPAAGQPLEPAADTTAAAAGDRQVRRPAEAAPIARETSVMAVEPVDPAYGCGDPLPPPDSVPPALPRLPGPSMLTLLAEVEAARDSLAARTDTLGSEVEMLRQRLQETEQELERIRRTLRP